MPRKVTSLFSVACLVLILIAAVSCGSAYSGKGTACTGGPYNVVGDWNGVFTSGGQTLNTVGVIDSSGLALFFDGSGDSVLMPAITGACSFSGTLTAYTAPGLGGGSAVLTTQGNVNSATSITGTESGTGGSGALTFTASSPLSASPTALVGTKVGSVGGGSDLLNLTFMPAGAGSSMSFTGMDIGTGCNVAGTFTQQGTSNVFDVSYVTSGAGATCGATSTGIAFESSTDYFNVNGGLPGTYLYADIVYEDLLGPAGAFVIETHQ